MWATCTYQILNLLRSRITLLWTMGLPISLSLIFMGMFSNLDQVYRAEPIAIGVVHDEAFQQAPGLDETVTALATGDDQLITMSLHGSVEEAEQAAKDDDILGYIAVDSGVPVLRLTTRGNSTSSSLVLRAVLDSYVQKQAEYAALAAQGLDPQQLATAEVTRVFTERTQVTKTVVKPATRYYYALLAFTCGMGALMALEAVRNVAGRSSAVGARRTLAGIPRWKVLLGTIAGAWICMFGCMIVVFMFLKFVAGVQFGSRAGWLILAIALSTLMTCAGGSVLGTIRQCDPGIVSAISCLLSLFTGLYGDASQRLANMVEQAAPLVAQINPLWQSTRSFLSLLYYDEMEPFVRSCMIICAMAGVFFVIALIRMRRMSYERL